MPLLFLAIGSVFLIAGVRGTQSDLFTLLKGDFTGQNNFLFWIAAIAFIAAVGLIDDLRDLSNAFLVLLIVVIILSNKGFFSNLTAALKSTANA